MIPIPARRTNPLKIKWRMRFKILRSWLLSLSAPIHNYGNISAVLFFPTKTLSVEWIRFLVFYFGQDLQDKWDFFRLRRDTLRPKALISRWSCKSCLIFFIKLESIPQILRYCIYETMNLALNHLMQLAALDTPSGSVATSRNVVDETATKEAGVPGQKPVGDLF